MSFPFGIIVISLLISIPLSKVPLYFISYPNFLSPTAPEMAMLLATTTTCLQASAIFDMSYLSILSILKSIIYFTLVSNHTSGSGGCGTRAQSWSVGRA